MGAKPDFSGWATKANLRCTDGRTITTDAFKHQDQMEVPLVWNHGHGDPDNILGKVLLTHKDEGIWADAFFNSASKSQNAKIAVQHGDIKMMSIFANQLVEKTKNVLHGMIREVSLVLAGANKGATIESVSVTHSDGSYEELDDAAVIFTGLDFELVHGEPLEEKVPEVEATPDEVIEHADDAELSVEDIVNSMTDKQKNVLYYLVGAAAQGNTAKHSDVEDDEAPSKELINEVYHSMNEDQQGVLQALLDHVLEHADTDAAVADDTDTEGDAEGDKPEGTDTADNTAAHSDTEEGTIMKHNVFDSDASLSHEGMGRASSGSLLDKATQSEILKQALRHGGTSSLKEFLEDYMKDNGDALAHAEGASDELKHGINNIGLLFPDAKNVTQTPNWLARRQNWVAKVLDGTRHVPFSNIKSQDANLTLDAARAKGYVKGNMKKEEFFGLTQRITTPQTIYKKQALDRDDIIDITDFDVVVWLKGEMRLMLDEEIARAILLGDGRDVSDEDKIKEDRIRPIAKDADYYATKVYVNIDDANSDMDEVIDQLTLNRRHYRGTGNPTFFTSETFVAKCLTIKDAQKRRVYGSEDEVRAALRVSDLVTVELLDEPTTNVVGILVNLSDYTVGANKGGEVSLFDDFDIDFNKFKYLIETRISGALVKAKSAVIVLKVNKTDVLVDADAPTWNGTNHTVTVPTKTGLTYKNKATNATLTNGSPVTLNPGDELVVLAVANSGFYLADSVNDEFSYTYEKGRVAGSLY